MGYLVYYGHSAFEVNVEGKKILIDPWLTNPLSPVKPDEIRDVDLVVLTHGHADHRPDGHACSYSHARSHSSAWRASHLLGFSCHADRIGRRRRNSGCAGGRRL